MIVLFTDFGWQDPYVGQVKAVLAEQAPGQPIIDLLHAVPDFNAHAGAQLLAALASSFPKGTTFLCVVDPGVGSEREAIVVEADGRYFVGPDNGLLSIVAGRAAEARYWKIVWRPERCAPSFHGRDLFAPIAAWIASGPFPEDRLARIESPQVQFDTADLPRVIYIDHYGNAWTGLRAGLVATDQVLRVGAHSIGHARTFAEVEKGSPFWYENSSGLVEIAVNRGHAATALGLKLGDPVRLSAAPGSHLH